MRLSHFVGFFKLLSLLLHNKTGLNWNKTTKKASAKGARSWPMCGPHLLVCLINAFLSSDWIKHDHIFSNDQCGALEILNKRVSIQDIYWCQQACINKNGCNAFNWVVNKNQQGNQCFFFICPKPIPSPESYRKGDFSWIYVQDSKGKTLSTDGY